MIASLRRMVAADATTTDGLPDPSLDATTAAIELLLGDDQTVGGGEALVELLTDVDSSEAARDSAIRALLAFAASAPTSEKRDVVWEALARSLPSVALAEADWLSTDPLLPDCIAALARTLREASQYSSSTSDPKRLPRLRQLSALTTDLMKSTGTSLRRATGESCTEDLVNCCGYMLRHDDPLVQAAGVQALRIYAEDVELVAMAADLLLSLLPRLSDVLHAAAEGLSEEPPRRPSPTIEAIPLTKPQRAISGDLGDDDDLGTSTLDLATAATVAHTVVQPGGHPPGTMSDGLAALRDLCQVGVFRNRCIGLLLPELAASLVTNPELRGLAIEFWEAVAAPDEHDVGGHWSPAQDGGADVWISEQITERVVAVAASCVDVQEAAVLTRMVEHWLASRSHQVLTISTVDGGLLAALLAFLDFPASTVELQLQCLHCIAPSLPEDAVRAVFIAEHGLAKLCGLLRSGSGDVVTTTLAALEQLCVYVDIADAIEEMESTVEYKQRFFAVFTAVLLPSSTLHRAVSVPQTTVKPAVQFLAKLLSDQHGEPTSGCDRHCAAMALQGMTKPILNLMEECIDRHLLIDLLLCLKPLLSHGSELSVEHAIDAQCCALLESVIRQAADDNTREQELSRDCLLILGRDLDSSIFFDSGGLRALRTLAGLPDSASRVMATRWMKQMALTDRDTLLRDVGLSLLFRSGFDHQRLEGFEEGDTTLILANTMDAVSAMIDDADFQLQFCNEGGLERAIAVRNALASLASVVATQEIRCPGAAAIEPPPLDDAPPPVLGQDGRRMSVQEAASIKSASAMFADWLRGTLVLIIGNRDVLPAIVDAGGVEILIDVIADGEEHVRLSALQALIKLSASRHLCEKIARGDACQRMFSYFHNSTGEEEILLLDVLANLLTADGHARNLALEWTENGASVLDKVHKLFTSGAAESTASKILCVCVENLRSSVVLAHRWWLPFLLSCLDNNDVLRSITAAKLAELSQSILDHPSPQPLAVEVVHIQTVFSVVESGTQTDAQLRVDLVLFLLMLSRSKQQVPVLLNPDVSAVHHLVRMLKKYHSSEPALLVHTFSTCGSTSNPHHSLFSRDVSERLLLTVTNLLRHQSAVNTFCAMNGMNFLFGLLSTRDLDLLEEVARATHYCTRSPFGAVKSSRRDAIDFGSSPSLAGLLSDPTALSKLVVPLREGLVVTGARGGSSRHRGKVRVRYLANLWLVMSNLMVVPEVCTRFVEDHDGIRLLISYLRYDVNSDWHVRVETAAAQAMDVLSSRQPHLNSDLVDAGALNAIFAVLSDPRHCIARTAAVTSVVNVLSNMAEEEALCRKLVQRGTASVVAPLLSFSFVARNAALVLFHVSCFRQNRIRLLEAGVHEAMMEIGTNMDDSAVIHVDGTAHRDTAVTDAALDDEPAFWCAFTLCNLIDVAPSDDGSEALFESFPALQEAPEWLYEYVRSHPPERVAGHHFPDPQLISGRYIRSTVGVCQHLGLWCAAHMTFQRATYWSKYRSAFVGSGLVDRLTLLLHTLEKSGAESESSTFIKIALRNVEAVEVTRFSHVKVNESFRDGALQKQGSINLLSWKRNHCTLVRGTGMLQYTDVSSTGGEPSKADPATRRCLYLLPQAQGQERGIDAVRANEEKRPGCFEVNGYPFESQALTAAAGGTVDDAITTLYFEAPSRAEMYAWVLAIRRELSLRDREPVPDGSSSTQVSDVSGLPLRHYSLEHRELLCDDCVGAGRTPKGFAVMPDQLQPVADAARDAARRAQHVLETSYDLRDIFVSSSESLLEKNEESKERSLRSVQELSEEVSALADALELRQQALFGELLTARRTEEEKFQRKMRRLEDVVVEVGHQLTIAEHVIDGADDIRILKYEKSIVERLESLTLKEQLPVAELWRRYVSDPGEVILALERYGAIETESSE